MSKRGPPNCNCKRKACFAIVSFATDRDISKCWNWKPRGFFMFSMSVMLTRKLLKNKISPRLNETSVSRASGIQFIYKPTIIYIRRNVRRTISWLRLKYCHFGYGKRSIKFIFTVALVQQLWIYFIGHSIKMVWSKQSKQLTIFIMSMI